MFFLSDLFYSDFPNDKFPEIEKKQTRPYIQILVEVGDLRFAILLRSHINHPHVFWTDKMNRCGVDFSKAVLIKNESYIDAEKIPHLRQNEFDMLRGKDFRIKQKMLRYIQEFKKAKENLGDSICKTLYEYSTLKYFEDEI